MGHTLIHTPRSQNDLAATSRTLIVYVSGKIYASPERNFAFLIQIAVRESHDADYYFILQQINNETLLLIISSNAYYIQHSRSK
jgi:hypothetical protein